LRPSAAPPTQYALLTSSAPVARFSKLFLDALPALRVSGRLRHEDNKVRNCALEALPAHHGTSGGSSGRLSALLPLQAQVKATLYLKHRQSLGAHTALNAKVELHARGQIGGPLSEVEKRVEGRLELSQKLLNLTGAWPWPAARPESALTCTASGASRKRADVHGLRPQTARTAASAWATTRARGACMRRHARTTSA